MYQPDAVAALTLLARALRSGGLIVFHEHDATMVPASLVSMPLHRQAQTWIREMLQREGANLHMGFDLYAALTQAGLAVEQVRAEAIVATPRAGYDVAGIVRAVLPRIVSHGVASEDAITIDTLERRLDEERTNTNATYIGDICLARGEGSPTRQFRSLMVETAECIVSADASGRPPWSQLTTEVRQRPKGRLKKRDLLTLTNHLASGRAFQQSSGFR